VKGIGPSNAEAFAERSLVTVKDLLLFAPLRYEDRSTKKQISELQPGELVTVVGEITASSNYYKGRRSIQSATIKDGTGHLKLMWFNNPHVVDRLVKGKIFFVSGKLNDRGTMIQPTTEPFTEDTIHTGRLVPIYSAISGIPPATLRRLLKHILDVLDPMTDELQKLATPPPYELSTAFQQIHFPDSEEHIVVSRERFALEELLALIQYSHQLKEEWYRERKSLQILSSPTELPALPFELTDAQKRCTTEVLADIAAERPMNRLLIGDVGSGKTAVAGIACHFVLAAGHNACFVAPTQILAEQHCVTFQKLFPQLPIQLLTGKTKLQETKLPTLYIGTHAVFSKLDQLQPALVIYDEQHRFGVRQRSLTQSLSIQPHILTLSATPIPRTLMLTIFSHLSLSVIDELPPGRKPVKTWLVPESKRQSSYEWIAEQLKTQQPNQALIVCPFIDTSRIEALENVAAAKEMYEQIQATFSKLSKKSLRISLLHGKVPKKEQLEITTQLYQKEIDILVTTPIVEVGVDLPAASIIVIEAAERFGLASLHQLRGRVGRATQQSYCLLFTNAKDSEIKKRLTLFSRTHNGLELAEQDLQRRGAGDIFGLQQHGFDDLQFATWSNLELITQARQLFELFIRENITYHSLLEKKILTDQAVPLAN